MCYSPVEAGSVCVTISLIGDSPASLTAVTLMVSFVSGLMPDAT